MKALLSMRTFFRIIGLIWVVGTVFFCIQKEASTQTQNEVARVEILSEELPEFVEEERSSLVSQDIEIRWMHIQKTGSWFGEFLLLWACDGLRRAYVQGALRRNDTWSLIRQVEEEEANPDYSEGFVKRGMIDISLFAASQELGRFFTPKQHQKCQATLLTGRGGYGFHHPYLEQNVLVPRLACSRRGEGSASKECMTLLEKGKFGPTITRRSREKGTTKPQYWLKVSSKGKMVTLFREPLSRVVSAFNYHQDEAGSSFGPMLPKGFPGARQDRYRQRVYRALNSAPVPVVAYAKMQGISQCQLKMVMGVDCGAPQLMHRPDLDQAKRRLNTDFAFIGLLEESRATFELFLKMFGGGNSAHYGGRVAGAPKPYEWRVRHNSSLSHDIRESLKQTLQNAKWRDPLEEELYAEAQRIFYARCKAHGIKTRIGY